MKPYSNSKRPLIASFFLIINFLHAISESATGPGISEGTLFVRPLLKNAPSGSKMFSVSHSVPPDAVSGTRKPDPPADAVAIPVITEKKSVLGSRKHHPASAIAPPGTSKSKPAVIPNTNLNKICNETDYPDLCVSTLTPFFKGKTYTISVLKISILAAIKDTKGAISFAQKMANSSTTPPEIASILEDCVENYSDAVDNFHSAQKAIPEKDTGTISTMLSAAISDYETCNDEFSGSNPMDKYGDRLGKMTDNSLVFTSWIK